MNPRWLALLLVLLTHSPGLAMSREFSLLQPKTYRSSNGVYSVYVDPSDRHGIGKANYRLMKDGNEIWKKEFPFSLWHACIGDNGTFGGAGYSHGYDGRGDDGDFEVALIDAAGNLRLHQKVPRGGSRPIHGVASPTCNGVFFDPTNDRMVVRVDESEPGEYWWSYHLSDGSLIAKSRPLEHMPDIESIRSILRAQPIVDTPLTLVQWWSYQYEPTLKLGTRFCLFDLECQCVWELKMPQDYTIANDEKAQDQLRDDIWKSSAILRADRPKRFGLRFVKDAQQVAFGVEKTPKGEWVVREIERMPYQPPAKPAAAAIPDIQLKKLHSVVLQSDTEDPNKPIRDIMSFRIDGQGRLTFLRQRHGGEGMLVMVDQNGKLLHELRLNRADMKRYDSIPEFAWIGGERFVVTNCDFETDEKAMVWVVDLANQSIERLGEFECPKVKEIEGTSDGGFVVLTEFEHRFAGGYTSEKTAIAFDKKGRQLWKLRHGHDEGALFSPKAIAVTTKGEVVVLDAIAQSLQFFDKGGGYLRTVKLSEKWGRRAHYPSELSADVDGGVVVGDFNGQFPFVRMKADDTVCQQLDAKYPDAQTNYFLRAQVAPDGKLWTSDKFALLRLNEKGEVDHVVGEKPDPKQLGRIQAVTIDHRGRILAIDERTSSTHVFDATGRHQFVCQLDLKDLAGSRGFDRLTVDAKGNIYVCECLERRFLQFSADGKRNGFVPRKFDDVCEDWYGQPERDRLWVATFHELQLLEGDKTLRTLTRRPDDQWLEQPKHGTVARDGSIAVVTSSSWNKPERDAIHIYRNNGEPVRTIEIHESFSWLSPLAYDVGVLALADNGKVAIFDDTGKPIGQFAPLGAAGEKCYIQPYLRAKDGHLIIFDGERTLTWFELPKK